MFRTVWLLRNLTLDGKLSLECCIFISSRFLAIAGKHGKRHAMPAHKQQAVSDWLTPHSLGTISAFGSIANLA